MAKQPETVGQPIRAAREVAGISAEELARAIREPWRRVVAWEADAELPDVTMLQRIARLLSTRFVIE